MEQHHPQHKLSNNNTSSTPAHLPPQLALNNNSQVQEVEVELDDNKNGVVLLLPPTRYTFQTSNNNNTTSNSNVNLKPPPLPGADEGVRYRECLKNHGASMGTNVVDGCGEFMPGGKDGTIEALKCAACQCHRNFHRRDHGFPTSAFFTIRSGHHHQIVQPMTAVAYGGGATESASDDLVFDEMTQREYDHHRNPVAGAGSNNNNRKRFRTKFTQEQKEKMLQFAEKLGWRLQRQDGEMVERFCNEVGVRRQVLKVWMHNNKNSFKKQLPLFITPTPASGHEDSSPPPLPHPQIQIHPLLHLHHQQQQQQHQQETL